MSEPFVKLDRCISCSRRRAEYILSGTLELCLECVYARLKPVDDCYRVRVTLEPSDAVECWEAYDNG
jgi:hypothetical protein